MSAQERAGFHRQQLRQKLGLTAQGKVFSTGLEKLFDDDDLLATYESKPSVKPVTKESEVMELSALSNMSARERNRAKRKAKMAAKKNSREKTLDSNDDVSEPSSKKPRTSSVVVEQAGESDKVLIDQVADTDAFLDETDEWPFSWFCEEMLRNLFSPQWEVRHGAASALREVLKQHGSSAGISAQVPLDKRAMETQQWLVDAAIRLLCVFTLDRFADFVSDQVVAPVRATCAQVLGVVCRLLDQPMIEHVVGVLLVLVRQEQWEVRHAALMGMQHLLASRTDMSEVLLPMVGEAILHGLQDVDDDVRAVAAGALLPVANKLHLSLPSKVPQLLKILWDSLQDLDDLSASTSIIMDLLSTILNSLPLEQSMLLHSDKLLSQLVPRLFPFLTHGIQSVRFSCLNTIKTLMGTNNASEEEPLEAASCVTSQQGCKWMEGILQTLVCHVFQRIALEGDEDVLALAQKVWEAILLKSSAENLASATANLLVSWICLLASSSSVPVDVSLLVTASPTGKGGARLRDMYLGGSLGVESVMAKELAAFAARVSGARAIGQLGHKILSSGCTYTSLNDSLKQMLCSLSATYKTLGALIATFLGQCPVECLDTLSSSLTKQMVYEEMSPFLLALQKDCHILVSAFDRKDIDASGGVNPGGYTAEFAIKLGNVTFDKCMQSLELPAFERQEFETLRRNLLTTLGQLQEQYSTLQAKVQCCIAGSVVMLKALPPKLNPVIKPLMENLKNQSDPLLQSLAGRWLAVLLELCCARTPCPNTKIIKNLCGFLCCNPDHTPNVLPQNHQAQANSLHPSGSQTAKEIQSRATSPLEDDGRGVANRWTWNMGIITLDKNSSKMQMRVKDRRGPGRPSAAGRVGATSEEAKSLLTQLRGGEIGLSALAEHFDYRLFSALPELWKEVSSLLQPLSYSPVDNGEDTSPPDHLVLAAQKVVNSLQVLEVLAPSVHSALQPKVLSLLPSVLDCLCSQFTAVRHMAARCLTTFAQASLHCSMQFIIDKVVPYLNDSTSVVHRQGAIEAIYCLLESVNMDLLCYVVLLIMPVLGCMSNQDRAVRLIAAQCFASLVTFMPLESGVESPPEMAEELRERRKQETHFLEQLLDTSKLENYHVPVPIKADLRKYQQDGINWLAFLNKYKLHGILCDDMGLGKTLQSICIIAGDTHLRDQEYQATGRADCVPLPSLVICPPTLTGHWVYEVKKFCDLCQLNPLQYAGPPSTRVKIQKQVPKHNLIIASYDIVRNDIDFFRSIDWNYCILDEGHIIKNSKTKITKAVKQIHANHRLILSGTPIQNNVLELWSLFDFLMPGFLGSERQFSERYGRPILLSRDAKSSSKDQEAGALAMEALHRQVLPFLLRRMKEDVLQDLPPKIIQDYHCDLSPLQVQLYEDFAKSRVKKQVEDVITGEEEDENEVAMTMDDAEAVVSRKKKDASQNHIFQALQYLRKVCNHPALVVNKDHPMYHKVMAQLQKEGNSLRDIKHSAKLLALRQLLYECGIGMEEEEGVGAVVSQHRVLLFCQYKSMLDIIENDLLKAHMPSVTYMRLDGSVPASNRHSIVHRFNMDPSIDLLLLTTHVGGLGLNLTGADTVVFFEHDWNPMKDLQAMDRAHRIGQKRVVNVYRLITKGTLEEKIMSLQKFKLNIANTVITQENSSLLSMNTSDLLDLFQLDEDQARLQDKNISDRPVDSGTASKGLKTILEALPALWNEEDYKSEYDIQNFVQSLQPK